MPIAHCPDCPCERTVKTVHIDIGKQRDLCRNCGGQLVEHQTHKVIDSATRELIDQLLLERISMAGIARAIQVFEQGCKTRSPAK